MLDIVEKSPWSPKGSTRKERLSHRTLSTESAPLHSSFLLIQILFSNLKTFIDVIILFINFFFILSKLCWTWKHIFYIFCVSLNKYKISFDGEIWCQIIESSRFENFVSFIYFAVQKNLRFLFSKNEVFI